MKRNLWGIFSLFILLFLFMLSSPVLAANESKNSSGQNALSNPSAQKESKSVILAIPGSEVNIGDLVETNERGYRWKQAGQAYEAFFSDEPQAGLFEFRAKGGSVSLGLEGEKQKGKVQVDKKKINFLDLGQDMEIQYSPLSSGIKEEIILKNPGANAKLDWKMKLDGVAYEIGNDGSIIFRSVQTGEILFRFLKPFMIDASGNRSDSAFISVEENGGKLKLKLDVDEAWLNDPIRAYPVIIDPTVVLEQDPSSGMDAYITGQTGLQGTNYGYADRLAIGRIVDGSTVTKERGLIKFNLSSLPKGRGVITSATLRLYALPDSTSTVAPVAYPIKTPWLEREVTWTEAQKGTQWTVPGGDHLTDAIYAAQPANWEYTFDVTSLVEHWINNDQYFRDLANDGLILTMPDETNGATEHLYLASSDNFDPQLRPRLEVTYTEDVTPPDVELDAPTVSGGIATEYVAVIDEGGADRVELYLDGAFLALLTEENIFIQIGGSKLFSYDIDLANLSNGNHTLTARGYDLAGNSSEASSIALVKDTFTDSTRIDEAKSDVNVDQSRGAVNLYQITEASIENVVASSVKDDPVFSLGTLADGNLNTFWRSSPQPTKDSEVIIELTVATNYDFTGIYIVPKDPGDSLHAKVEVMSYGNTVQTIDNQNLGEKINLTANGDKVRITFKNLKAIPYSPGYYAEVRDIYLYVYTSFYQSYWTDPAVKIYGNEANGYEGAYGFLANDPTSTVDIGYVLINGDLSSSIHYIDENTWSFTNDNQETVYLTYEPSVQIDDYTYLSFLSYSFSGPPETSSYESTFWATGLGLTYGEVTAPYNITGEYASSFTYAPSNAKDGRPESRWISTGKTLPNDQETLTMTLDQPQKVNSLYIAPVFTGLDMSVKSGETVLESFTDLKEGTYFFPETTTDTLTLVFTNLQPGGDLNSYETKKYYVGVSEVAVRYTTILPPEGEGYYLYSSPLTGSSQARDVILQADAYLPSGTSIEYQIGDFDASGNFITATDILPGTTAALQPSNSPVLRARLTPSAGVSPELYGWELATPGQSVTLTVNKPVVSNPPVIAILGPDDGEVVSDKVTVIVFVQSETPVKQVRIYIDSVLYSTTYNPPYTFLWNTSGYSNTTHEIKIEVVDANNTYTTTRRPVVFNWAEDSFLTSAMVDTARTTASLDLANGRIYADAADPDLSVSASASSTYYSGSTKVIPVSATAGSAHGNYILLGQGSYSFDLYQTGITPNGTYDFTFNFDTGAGGSDTMPADVTYTTQIRQGGPAVMDTANQSLFISVADSYATRQARDATTIQVTADSEGVFDGTISYQYPSAYSSTSTVQTHAQASNVRDNNLSTAWKSSGSSVFGGTEWLQIDLGTVYNDLKKYGFTTYSMGTTVTKIEVSPDGATWTLVGTPNYAVGAGSSYTYNDYIKRSGRYVRFTFAKTGYAYGAYMVWIAEAYAYQEYPTYYASNAIDNNNYASYWSTQTIESCSSGEYLTIDLGESQAVNTVNLLPLYSSQKVAVELSNDGVNYTRVAESTASEIHFTDTTARYVKLYFTKMAYLGSEQRYNWYYHYYYYVYKYAAGFYEVEVKNKPTYYSLPITKEGKSIGKVRLDTQQTTPSGTRITYSVSMDNGATWNLVTPGVDTALPKAGKTVILRASFSGASAGAVPELREWSLTGLEETDVVVQVDNTAVVKPPASLVAKGVTGGGANLTWRPSTTTGVTYNVYRGTLSNFALDATTLRASGLTTTSWNDPSTGWYYYRVTAKNSADQESRPSNEVYLYANSTDTRKERLGLESYWPYFAYELADGTAYVNTSNGNLAFQVTDLVLPGGNTVVAFTRTYNSMATEDYGLGYGWDYNHNIRLTLLGNGNVRLKDGDGTYFTFVFDAVTQTYSSPPGLNMDLVRNAGGTYTITLKDQTRYRFFSDGFLAGIEDRYGKNNLTYQYTTMGGQPRLTVITDPAGRVTNLYWTGIATNNGTYYEIYKVIQTGRPAGPNSGTQPASRNINFTYDSNGNLTGAANAEGAQYLYFYNEKHQLVQTLDPLNHQTDLTYRSNGELTNIYYTLDAQNIEGIRFMALSTLYEAIATTNYAVANGFIAYTHNSDGTLYQRLMDGDDSGLAITTFEYDGDYNVTSVTDPRGYVSQYQYDNNGNLLQATDPAGNITLYEYNNQNDLTLTTYPGWEGSTSYNFINDLTVGGYVLNNITTNFGDGSPAVTTGYTYTPNGQIATETDATGITAYSYYPGVGYLESSSRSNLDQTLTSQTTYEYDAFGKLSRVIGPDNRVTLYSYDKIGRLLKTTYPDGSYEANTYDAAGNLTSSRDQNGNVTSYQYDARNRLIQGTAPGKGTVTYQYDAFGNLLLKNDNGQATRFEYDDSSRLIAEVKENVSQYNPNDNWNPRLITLRTEYTYDLSGNPKTKTVKSIFNGTTEESYTVNFQYNNRDLLERVEDGTGYYLTYTYDALGNLASTTERGNAQRVTDYDYDALGRLKRVTEPSSNGIVARGVTTYEYDGNGNRTKVTDALGNVTDYNYDYLDLPKSKVQTVTSGIDQSSYDISDENIYDLSGKLTAYRNPNGDLISYEYDIMGRLAKTTYPSGEMVKYTYDPMRKRLTMTDSRGATYYTYDQAGRLLTETGPDGQKITYEYDNLGNRTKLTVTNNTAGSILTLTYAYDQANRLIKITDITNINSPRAVMYRYDARNLPTAIKYPNGDTVTMEYDAAGNLTKIEAKNSSNQITSYQYLYDSYNNRSRVILESGDLIEYHYDNLDRLTNVYYPTSNVSYTYDLLGNRKDDGKNSYTYNSINQLERVKGKYISKQTDYRYDKSGNQVAIIDERGEAQYIYDYEKRLKEIVFPNNDHVWYSYDGDGRRVYQKDGVMETYYGYDGSAPVVHYDGSGAVVASYLRGIGGNLVSTTQQGGAYYYHLDGLGSVVAMTDKNGTKKAIYDYDAFGNQTSPKPDIYNPYGFTGGLYDQSPGLYLFGARYYNPQTGRFITQDTYQGSTTEPWTQQLYTYVGNNPVNYIDPTGHFAIPYAVYVYMSALLSSPDLQTDLALMMDDLASGNYVGAAASLVGVAVPGVSATVTKAAGENILSAVGKVFKGTGKTATKMDLQLFAKKGWTAKAALKEAERLGFKKTNYLSHGQPVFKKGNRYITTDIDSHSGGVWKMADSVKNLGSKKTRIGTYDEFLNRIGD